MDNSTQLLQTIINKLTNLEKEVKELREENKRLKERLSQHEASQISEPEIDEFPDDPKYELEIEKYGQPNYDEQKELDEYRKQRD